MLITEPYKALNVLMHEQSERYGSKGRKHAAKVIALMKEHGFHDVLDYGCGKGGLATEIHRLTDFQVYNYDPCVVEYSAEPVPADLVVSTSVLEHVEEGCVPDVLAHMATLTKHRMWSLIGANPSEDKLPDGTNTHATIKPIEWWQDRIARHFDVLSMRTQGKWFEVTCRC